MITLNRQNYRIWNDTSPHLMYEETLNIYKIYYALLNNMEQSLCNSLGNGWITSSYENELNGRYNAIGRPNFGPFDFFLRCTLNM